MRATDLESDNFKFYLRTMVKEGWVVKTAESSYQLSTSGKTFANNLNEAARTVQRQPKLSVIIVVSRQASDGTEQFLLHQRSRHPFYGFWGFLSGPIHWGELPEEAAQRELMKQTGLEGVFTVSGIYRQRTYNKEEALLEDGLFTIMRANSTEGELDDSWQGGENKWMNREEIQKLQPKFKDTDETLAGLEDPPFYAERTVAYDLSDY
jgi:ADP-ribose pyrophosphatase YjhB (NUDIX family)